MGKIHVPTSKCWVELQVRKYMHAAEEETWKVVSGGRALASREA